MALAALVAEAELYPAARENRFARPIDAPVAFLDLGGSRCGGARRAVEALKVGTDPTADAGLGAGLIPIIRLTYGALRAAWGRTKALSNLGLRGESFMGCRLVAGWWATRYGYGCVLLVLHFVRKSEERTSQFLQKYAPGSSVNSLAGHKLQNACPAAT